MNVHFIQHVPFETPGALLNWCKENNHPVGFSKMYKSASLPSSSETDLLIIMCGPMSVGDVNRYPWLPAEKKFIKEYINSGKKMLGICLGSQLIAEAMGAKVFPNEEIEIGWWPVINLGDSLPKNLPDTFETFHWHGETFDLPSNADLIFTTDACNNQGFLVGSQIAALQFHMEMDLDLMKSMIEHGRDELKPGKFIQTEKEMLDNGEQFLSQQKGFMRSFLDYFLNL